MKQAIKESLLLGLGVASISKSRVDSVLRKFQKEGMITKKQADEIKKSVLKAADEQKKLVKKAAQTETARWKKELQGMRGKLEARGKKEAERLIKKAQKALR